jgi:phospholipid-binding lipoprotein MlaA
MRLLVVASAVGLGWPAELSCPAAAQADPAASPHRRADNDPIEPVNRAIFWFNDKVDVYVLEPVATGYDKITPNRVKRCVSNFFQNLRFPIDTVNNLLQGKVAFAATHVGRFVVNTTIGVAGFFDPASSWGLPAHTEDFGQTLGYWGVPPGPYLVLPLWGPSNPRDTVGLGVDSAMAVYPWLVAIQYTLSSRVVDIINTRSQVLKEVRQVKEASLDYYVAVRNAYVQRRRILVHDAIETPAQEEDLYNVDTNNGG